MKHKCTHGYNLPTETGTEFGECVDDSLSLCLSLSFRPKPSIPPVKLSFRGGRLIADADDGGGEDGVYVDVGLLDE